MFTKLAKKHLFNAFRKKHPFLSNSLRISYRNFFDCMNYSMEQLTSDGFMVRYDRESFLICRSDLEDLHINLD